MKRAVYWSVSITILATAYVAFFLAGAVTGILAGFLSGAAGEFKAANDRLILLGRTLRQWSRA